MSNNLLSKYLHSKNYTRLLSTRIFLWQRINEPWLAFHLTGLSAATSCCFHLYPASKMSSRKATGRRSDQITDREDWTMINSWRAPPPPSASPHPRARPRPSPLGRTYTHVRLIEAASGEEAGPGNSVQTAYTDFDVIAPSWGRSDGLHYFRKSCCLSDMLNYSKEPLIIQRNRKFNVLVVTLYLNAPSNGIFSSDVFSVWNTGRWITFLGGA